MSAAVIALPAADYGLHIFPQHAELLSASAISAEVSRARGYVSADTKKQLERYHFESYQQKVPGLLIPLHRADGSVWGYQLRPDKPRVTKAGAVVKYETPRDQRNGIDFPPGVRDVLGDPTVTMLVTEGTRKADAAVSAGLACVALAGVWSWRGKSSRGGKLAVPEWHDIALNGRRVVLAFDSDVSHKPKVALALAELAAYLATKDATVEYLHLPDLGESKTGLDDYLAAAGTAGIWELVRPEPPAAPESATPATSAASAGQAVADSEAVADTSATAEWDGDLSGLLDDAYTFLGRFVAYPSEDTRVAHTLWVAHTHAMDAWDSTPRISFLSPEPGSGKTRALEITELLVPRPVEAVNTTPAYLFRKVSDPGGLPTILYDEIDTLFGPKAKDNEEIRGMLNAGHRRGAVAGRAVKRGDVIETEELPAYCALALAGLGTLPDTLLTRSIVVRMKRRAPGEQVEPFRRRIHKDDGHAIRDKFAAWATSATAAGLGTNWPELPPSVTDRDADVWEPLLMIADVAAGDWPKRAREAAVALVADSKVTSPSLGVRLLADLRAIWNGADAMHTEAILEALNGLEEAPWGDLKGKPLDSRRLSRFLKEYGAHPRDVRADVDGDEKVRKGYRREDLYDAWQRYLPRTGQAPAACRGCGEPLDPKLAEAGYTTHGGDCDAEADG